MLRPLFVVFYIYSAWALLAVMTGPSNEQAKRIARQNQLNCVSENGYCTLTFHNLTFVHITFKTFDVTVEMFQHRFSSDSCQGVVSENMIAIRDQMQKEDEQREEQCGGAKEEADSA